MRTSRQTNNRQTLVYNLDTENDSSWTPRKIQTPSN